MPRPPNAKIGMLDLAVSQPTVGVLRDQGFLKGFGIDLKDPNKWGDEDDPRIVGNDVTAGQRGRRPPRDGEPARQGSDDQCGLHDQRAAAAGAYEALKAIGRENDVLIVSVDGGCPGVAECQADGVIGATCAAIPAADMASSWASRRSSRLGQGPAPSAEADRRQGLLRHGRGAGDGQAGRWCRDRSIHKSRARICAGVDPSSHPSGTSGYRGGAPSASCAPVAQPAHRYRAARAPKGERRCRTLDAAPRPPSETSYEAVLEGCRHQRRRVRRSPAAGWSAPSSHFLHSRRPRRCR